MKISWLICVEEDNSGCRTLKPVRSPILPHHIERFVLRLVLVFVQKATYPGSTNCDSEDCYDDPDQGLIPHGEVFSGSLVTLASDMEEVEAWLSELIEVGS